MRTKSETIEIYIGGDFNIAREICRHFCANNPTCVTVSRTEYIYTGGEESGVIVAFRSYPRFPTNLGEHERYARKLAENLMAALCQKGAMVVTPTEHEWLRNERIEATMKSGVASKESA